jgi:hypothetical protein
MGDAMWGCKLPAVCRLYMNRRELYACSDSPSTLALAHVEIVATRWTSLVHLSQAKKRISRFLAEPKSERAARADS